ncbi:helix-turn-helix domain-containing protein, partial [bacterium]|nr:helix-turn-helix domain-containing protein [bacterium]
NIFEIQDEISLIIADKLREQFGHFEIQDHLVEKQTESIDAYEYSLKAKFHFNKWNGEGMRKAISFYEKAIELDSTYTEALIGLADSFAFMGGMGFMPFEEAWGKTAQLTHEAHQLNDQLPGVRYQLSNMAFWTTCDYEEAFIQISKAIELNPNYAQAQQFTSFLYIVAGEQKKSRKHLEIALAIDPLSRETLFFNALFHYMIGDFSTALGQLDSCLEQNPENMPVHVTKCYCLLALGRYSEVLHYFDNTPPELIPPDEMVGLATLVYTLTGDAPNAAKYLSQLQEDALAPGGFNANSYLFLFYAASGENDKAFEWLDDAIKNRSPLMLMRFADPLAISLRADPRYADYQKIIFRKQVPTKKSKPKKKLLNADAIASYSNRLLAHFEEATPYLDPDLSLRSLAAQIEIHPNQLSWLLNEKLHKNFNEFVNHYRVEAFKRIAKDPKNAGFTIVAIAYDCGFNSKTVFNTYFKKETGLTPKQFLKQ